MATNTDCECSRKEAFIKLLNALQVGQSTGYEIREINATVSLQVKEIKFGVILNLHHLV